jgi:hypothetical protein
MFFLEDRPKPLVKRLPQEERRRKQRRENGLRKNLRDLRAPDSPCARKSTASLRFNTRTGTIITTIPAIAPENDFADEAHLWGPRQALRYRLGVGARRKRWAAPLEASKETATRIAKRAAAKREEEEKSRALRGVWTMRRRVV